MKKEQMKALLLALGFLVGGIIYGQHVRQALAQAPADAQWSTYRRVDWWILSAKCTQMRKVFLVACGPQNKLYPIEDVSPMDDRGHGLLADFVSLFISHPFNKVDMVQINVWINAAAIALLSISLTLCGMPWAGFLCLAVGAQYGIPGPMASADAQATFFGEYCLILVPVPWVIRLLEYQAKTRRFLEAGCISFLFLTIAILLREAIGMIGIFCAAVFTILAFIKTKPESWKLRGLYALVLALAILPVKVNSAMLTLRSRWLSLPPSHLIQAHGFTHALRKGLGTEPNPWGIRDEDEDGAALMQKINPQAMYGTPAYFAEMERLYTHIVLHDPLQVAAIYLIKLRKTIALPLSFCGILISRYALGVVILLPFLFHASRRVSLSLRMTAAMAVVLGVFLMQGVLMIASPVYLYPAKFGTLLLLMGLADAGMDWVFERKRKRSLDSVSLERS